MHRVAIIGGGFGGLETAKRLAKAPVSIMLVDRWNYHLFQPLLYQVATGGLSAADIAIPLRFILRKQKNVQVWMAEVTDIDVERRMLIAPPRQIPYDTLVVAAGVSNGYFGNDHWSTAAPGLKSLEDAAEIRARTLYAFEMAEQEPDPELRRLWLNFVIIGAGPTGVELAGALGEITKDTLREDFRNIRTEEARIFVLDMAPRVLPSFPEDLSAAAEHSLIRLGVRPLLGVRVVEIGANGVRFERDGRQDSIGARTVLWAAGVQGSTLGRLLNRRAGAELDRMGRVLVEPDCSLPGHPEIFVIGDLACYRLAGGNTLPGVAPVAVQQGRYVARLIQARLQGATLKPFRYLNKGTLATIGRHHAVADFGRLRFHGPLAWFLWLFVHLLYLVSFQNRLLVAIQWAIQYFTFNRRARLIVPPPRHAPAAEPASSSKPSL
ncbi:MAG: NAD(P)/FAD-dependent oxidoreductase [Bryobacteraceae bacterium]|nr:NAD(P)/FAD-dependent oxidoreductase [Bryobacteraceae bacterium]